MRTGGRRGRWGARGFTLAEMLVALALVAGLTAVAVPALSRSVQRAQAQRVAGDLLALTEALRAFYSHTQRIPATLGLLETAPATDGTAPAVVPGTVIPADLAREWKGPYLRQKNLGAALPTGFDGLISDTLSTGTLNGARYATVSVKGLTAEQFAAVDGMMDAGTGADAGVARYQAGTSTMTYYATPTN